MVHIGCGDVPFANGIVAVGGVAAAIFDNRNAIGGDIDRIAAVWGCGLSREADLETRILILGIGGEGHQNAIGNDGHIGWNIVAGDLQGKA